VSDWAREAERRAAANRGEPTLEDEVLRALREAREADAARLLARAELVDRDYLAYWVDELGLGARFRAIVR
jgi:hypothetical protein